MAVGGFEILIELRGETEERGLGTDVHLHEGIVHSCRVNAVGVFTRIPG